jgi:chromosome segregation ATPase
VAAQVLVKLGADLNRVRQQVIQLLHGYQGKEPESALGGPRQRELLSRVAARLNALESRLSAIEERVGTGPDTGDLDQQIEQVRGERHAAADAQEYEQAASLRDQEKDLLAERASQQEQWVAAHPDLPSLAGKFGELSDELTRLRALLSERGINPEDGAA